MKRGVRESLLIHYTTPIILHIYHVSIRIIYISIIYTYISTGLPHINNVVNTLYNEIKFRFEN